MLQSMGLQRVGLRDYSAAALAGLASVHAFDLRKCQGFREKFLEAQVDVSR